jgi:hypothetical protein
MNRTEPPIKANAVFEEPLRKLLADLHDADIDRQGMPRGSAQYDEAARRVDRIARAVWDAATPSADEDGGSSERTSDSSVTVTEL